MLTIAVPVGDEMWDEATGEVYVKEEVLQLEYSLVSISDWESKWHKPFLTDDEKTNEQVIDYIRFMTITPNVDPNVYNLLTKENVQQINDYIGNPMTATTFSNTEKGKKSREIVTSELIYYWMISLQIPVEFQYWHLNRLLTLIRVCEVKNQPPKKMSKREIMSRNAALNAQRRAKAHSKG